jgi:ADP-ribose pyrophosphatase YjhB (NUDIX family)
MTTRARGDGPRARQAPDEDEAAFLAAYDIAAWPRPSLTVDVAILTILERGMHVLVAERTSQPAKGRWALPGGFVRLDESLSASVERVLERETGLTDVYTAQLATFGDVGRDPRGRIVTVAHYALVPAQRVADAVAARPGCLLARIEEARAPAVDRIRLVAPAGDLPLAFDHGAIIATAVERVRGRLWYAPVAFELVPEEFTLLDLQRAYEAVLGHALDKNAFRRRLLASGLILPLGRRREGLRARPAELFAFTGAGRDA